MSLAERYPRLARSELRSLLLLPMLGCLFGGLVLALYGVRYAHAPAGWAAFAGTTACLAFAVGLYRLREWARWGAFVVALAFVTFALVDLVRQGLPRPWPELAERLVAGGYYVGLIVYLPSPAATRAFALARSRWVPLARRGPSDDPDR